MVRIRHYIVVLPKGIEVSEDQMSDYKEAEILLDKFPCAKVMLEDWFR